MPSQLTLGSFNLTQPNGSTRVLADGTSRGNPVPLETTVKTWLQDGAVVITQGYDNREMAVRVRFFGTDLSALNTLEASLFAELGKPNTLTWTPVSGPATVFDVVTSSLTFDDSMDEGEAQPDPWRTYVVRLICLPFARSASQTTTSALAATGTTTTLVNDGSATTNWTGAVNGVSTSPSVVSGAVKVTNGSAVKGTVTCSLTLTTSITTSSTKYLVIDWKPESPTGSPDLRAYGDGTELTKLAEIASPTSGFTRTWFGPVAASSIAALRLDSTSTISDLFAGAIRSLYVDNINRTDITPSLGTGRQLLRAITVGGSARAPGSIAIEHSTNALGDTLAYFYPNATNVQGYSPPMRQYRVSGGTVTSDATKVSGATEDILASTATYDVPWSKLPPGLHLLVVRLSVTSSLGNPAVLNWTSATRVNSTQVGSQQSGSFTVGVPSSQTMFAVARISLPSTDVDEATTVAVERLTLGATGATTVILDEAWLFNMDIGRLVGPVACGTGAAASGGPARRLFLEPATTARPRPTIRIGHASDRSDSFFPSGQLSGWEFPEFTPPRVNVLTVTTNATDASVTFGSFHHWHSNAAD